MDEDGNWVQHEHHHHRHRDYEDVTIEVPRSDPRGMLVYCLDALCASFGQIFCVLSKIRITKNLDSKVLPAPSGGLFFFSESVLSRDTGVSFSNGPPTRVHMVF